MGRGRHWQPLINEGGEWADATMASQAEAIVARARAANRAQVSRDSHIALVRSWAALVSTAARRQPQLLLKAEERPVAVAAMSEVLASIKHDGLAFDTVVEELSSTVLELLSSSGSPRKKHPEQRAACVHASHRDLPPS